MVNTAPVSEIQLVLDFETTEGFHFDSFSVVGTVAESFDDYGLNAASGDKFSYMMEVDELGDTTSVHLAPGTNTIIRLYFRTDATAFAGDSFTFDTTHIGGKYTYAMTPWGDYIPMVVQGTVYIDACGTGDFDCDGGITIADLVFLVD